LPFHRNLSSIADKSAREWILVKLSPPLCTLLNPLWSSRRG
jgi:hypothetical protein